jgi:nucleotide-binding universal stress UspA family protein
VTETITMEMHMLLATDMSPAAAHTLRYALALNRHFFAKLELMHVFDLPVAAMDEEGALLRNHDAVIKSIEQNLWTFLAENRGSYHFDTKVSAVFGGLYQALATRAREWPADLIITGHSSHARSSFWTSTGTGRQLFTHPPAPVLSVPESAIIPPVIRHILICTDLSEIPDEGAFQFLRRFSNGLNAKLSLLHVNVRNEIAWAGEQKVTEAWKEGLGLSLNILEHTGKDSLTHLLEEYVREHDIDLIAMFPHRHNWLYQLLLGSETGKVYDDIMLPVLSIPIDHERT